MVKNGISDENLNKLFTHAQINLRDQNMVRNLAYMGINVVTDVSALLTNELFIWTCSVNAFTNSSLWKIAVHREIAKRHIKFRERIALPSKHIKCHAGLQCSKTFLKTASMTNWTLVISHFWPVEHKMQHITHQPGEHFYYLWHEISVREIFG